MWTYLVVDVALSSFDFVGLAILLVLVIIHVTDFTQDARGYAKIDSLHKQ